MNKENINFRILVALALYLISLLAANTLGLKLMPFIFGTHLSVAVFFFPFVYLTTDVIGQVYGKQMAKNFVWVGLISMVLFMLYTVISLALPWSKESLSLKAGYTSVFGISLRMSIASLFAYFIAEYQDVIAFFFFKNKLKNKSFWLLSNLSNLWSQFLDTLVFMIIAFAGIYSFKTIIFISLPWWIYKVIMGFLYTPFSYWGINLLKYENKSNKNSDLSTETESLCIH
ncbi:MAG: queuosine precursor transporter [Patescibacteria group bacterium]